jgi:hypothetical protein
MVNSNIETILLKIKKRMRKQPKCLKTFQVSLIHFCNDQYLDRHINTTVDV